MDRTLPRAFGISNLIVTVLGIEYLNVQVFVASLVRVVIALLFALVAVDVYRQRSDRTQDRFVRMSDNSLQGMVVRNEQEFLYSNAASRAIYGLSSHTEWAAAQGSLLSADDVADVTRRVRSLMAGEVTDMRWTAERKRQDGASMVLSFHAWPIDWDDQPAVQMLITDETQRVESQKALQSSEAFKDALLQALPDMLFVKDLAGRYLLVNAAFERVYGRSQSFMLGKTDYDFLPAETAEFFRSRDLIALQAQGPVRAESWQVDVNGNRIFWETTKVRVVDSAGQGVGLLGIAHDSTARKKAEESLQQLTIELEQRVARRTLELGQANDDLRQALDTLTRTQADLVQREKLASLGGMVAGIAHELNTPIGNALLMATTLQAQRNEFEQQVQAGLRRADLDYYLRRSSEGMELLTSELQQSGHLVTSFKQVAADQVSEQRRHFDLATTTQQIGNTLEFRLRRSRVTLRTDIPPDILVDGYPGQFGQVLSNLIINAQMHAFEGVEDPLITVAARTEAEQVVLTVQDNGVGIAPANRNRVFDPFFTTRMGRGGTGLGLNLVHNMVMRVLGGSIVLLDLPTPGACFEVRMPRCWPVHEEPKVA